MRHEKIGIVVKWHGFEEIEDGKFEESEANVIQVIFWGYEELSELSKEEPRKDFVLKFLYYY